MDILGITKTKFDYNIIVKTPFVSNPSHMSSAEYINWCEANIGPENLKWERHPGNLMYDRTGIKAQVIFAFDTEEDAMAFKLVFDEHLL